MPPDAPPSATPAGTDEPSTPEDLERLHRILEISRNKLKAAFDSITDPIAAITPAGVVESVNMALARLAGRHPRELVGLDTDQVMELARTAEVTRRALHNAFEMMSSHLTSQHRLVEVEREDGSHYFDLLLTPVLDDGGRLTLAILQIKDVTAFKRMERTIRSYNQSLEQMVDERTKNLMEARRSLEEERDRLAQANEELKRLDQLRTDLTHMVVHDMKGPLAEVMGNLDLMAYEDLSPTQEEARELANLGAEDLLRMIMNLLDINRLEEGRLTVLRRPTVFGEMATQVAAKFKTVTRLKSLTVEVEDQVSQPFPADQDLLPRVLQNFLTNAIEHTPEEGRILLAAREGDRNSVLISVADNGEGIPEAAQHRIFDKFTQAEVSGNRRTSTGLGLTFCKMAVEAHQGRIWFESRPGQGTTFFISLPRQFSDPY